MARIAGVDLPREKRIEVVDILLVLRDVTNGGALWHVLLVLICLARSGSRLV